MDAVASRCSGNKWVPLQPASDTVWVDGLCVEQQPGETERVERVSERVREPKHWRRTLGLVKHWEDKPLGPTRLDRALLGSHPRGQRTGGGPSRHRVSRRVWDKASSDAERCVLLMEALQVMGKQTRGAVTLATLTSWIDTARPPSPPPPKSSAGSHSTRRIMTSSGSDATFESGASEEWRVERVRSKPGMESETSRDAVAGRGIRIK